MVIAVIVLWVLSALLRSFSPAVSGRRLATDLSVDDRGGVQVLLAGERVAQNAETGLRLYEGDTVSTTGRSFATLSFFDGSSAILDAATEVEISDVIAGEKESIVSFHIHRGRLWLETATGSQTIRTIHTALASYHIPPRTEMILGSDERGLAEQMLTGFTPSGPGVEADLSDAKSSVVVGEGQALLLRASDLQSVKEGNKDPYDLRSVLDDSVLSSALSVRASNVQVEEVAEENKQTAEVVDSEQLIIESPEDGALVKEETLLVQGKAGQRVVAVRVNGYEAQLAEGVFEKEIAVPVGEEEFSIEVQAEDSDGLIVASTSLALTQDIKPPAAPVITFPGGSGDTVSMNEDSFEITGTVSSDVTGVIVNGYQLQRFKPGQPWKYLVDPDIENVVRGENRYEVVALDRAGNRSEPSVITIVWKAEVVAPPVIEGGNVRDTSSYIAPGTLQVIAPGASPYSTAEEEILIEGTTHPDTYSVSVNGYSLSLYLPGKETWNYIASGEYNTLKSGLNRYTVVARNEEGRILDVVRYVIEKEN